MTNNLSLEAEQQIEQCLSLLKRILGPDLLAVYLHGSAIVGGLQKYSDLDLVVVIKRETTAAEKTEIINNLLQISGIYMQGSKPPIEMTLVVQAEVNPWHYPPNFDFQYGEWLRDEFVSGNIEPWATKQMPDLALLITHLLLANKTLLGPDPQQLLCNVPYTDYIKANAHELHDLMENLNSDTRNVLLTFARIWNGVETDQRRSKPAAADWVIKHLPNEYQPVLQRAKAISLGIENEYWDDIKPLIQPCADFILNKITARIFLLQHSDLTNRTITLAE